MLEVFVNSKNVDLTTWLILLDKPGFKINYFIIIDKMSERWDLKGLGKKLIISASSPMNHVFDRKKSSRRRRFIGTKI